MAGLGRDDPDEPIAVPVHTGRTPPDGDLAQAVREPVHAGQRGEGVVNGRRKRPDGNLDELVDTERDVLGERPVGPRDVRAAERVAYLRRRLGRPYHGERVPLDEEMPGPVVQGDDGVRLGGELNQDPVPDELQVAAHRRADHAAVSFHPADEVRCRGAALPVARGQTGRAS